LLVDGVGVSGTIAAPELASLLEGDRPLAVEFGEYASVTAMLMEQLGGLPFGSPPAWRKAVISTLDAREVAVLGPFVKSRPHDLPSCLCSLPHRTCSGLASLDEDLERIAAIPPDRFAAQLPSNGEWHAVARNPRRWLHAFARAVRRASEGLQGPWRDATGLLDREAERVGVAAVRGTERELVATRLAPGILKLEGPSPPGADLRRRVGMVPMLAGPGASHIWIIDGEPTHIAYPLPDAWRLLDGGAPPPAALEGLLGRQRALILRLLDRPLTAGKLAEALLAVPSAATHHLAILERAGLVERERQGRQVLARRTARGTEVLALYDQS